MAEIVHPRKLDRSKPYGESLGAITDDVHFTQKGYGFDALGNCVKVTPEAPDYDEWVEARQAAFREHMLGQEQKGTTENDQDPANPKVADDGAERGPVGGPAPRPGPVVAEPPAAPPPPAAEATADQAPPPPQPDPAPPAAEEGDGDNDDGSHADETGPIDPDMDWNELQAAMKAHNLPRPKNKEDARRILEERGLIA
jgi:cell division septation protein DedD